MLWCHIAPPSFNESIICICDSHLWFTQRPVILDQHMLSRSANGRQFLPVSGHSILSTHVVSRCVYVIWYPQISWIYTGHLANCIYIERRHMDDISITCIILEPCNLPSYISNLCLKQIMASINYGYYYWVLLTQSILILWDKCYLICSTERIGNKSVLTLAKALWPLSWLWAKPLFQPATMFQTITLTSNSVFFIHFLCHKCHDWELSEPML